MVLDQLVSIIGMIVNQSQNLPRPENTIARSDKMHLWPVEKDDDLVNISTDKITATLEENLEVVNNALDVYKEFLFILKEEERIEGFLKKQPFDRDQF